MDEVPAYLPSGAGPHLYVRVEKRGRTTAGRAAGDRAALGVPERDAGYAGLKDKDAVTTQWLSFPAPRDPGPGALEADGLRVLEVSRHANKLRAGHVRGNRFQLAVRGGELARARDAAAGARGGRAPELLRPAAVRAPRAGTPRSAARSCSATPRRRRAAPRAIASCGGCRSPRTRRCSSTAGSRADGGRAVRDGDRRRVLKKLDTGGLFTCADPAADGPRVQRFEISPAGPMFGHKLRAAEGEALAREERLLAAEAIQLSDFARGGGEAEGTARAARLRRRGRARAARGRLSRHVRAAEGLVRDHRHA